MTDKIKSVYDPKLMLEKRKVSAKKILADKDKLKIVADKNSTFFGVKSDKDQGYYTIKLGDNGKYICNCFDYARYIEYNEDHKCKHILSVEIAIKEKRKIAVKDLSKLELND